VLSFVLPSFLFCFPFVLYPIF
jgi:hypothetical protein